MIKSMDCNALPNTFLHVAAVYADSNYGLEKFYVYIFAEGSTKITICDN